MAMDFNFDSENKEQSFTDTTSYVNDSTDTVISWMSKMQRLTMLF